MTDPAASADSRSLLGLGLLSVVVVSAAYQVASPSELRLGSFLLSAPFVDGFHDAETGYRWTRARSCLTFPDPGPSASGRIELDVSGFRPRGQETPLALFEVGAETHRIDTPRRFGRVSFPARVEGLWTTSLELCVRSETFTPGPMDQRSLGVRIGSASFTYGDGLRFGLPPLRQLFYSTLAVLGIFAALSMAGTRRRTAAGGAVALLAVLGIAYVLARPHAALASGPLALLGALSFGLARFFPKAVALAGELVSEAGASFGRGARLVLGWRGVALAALAPVAVTAAFVARPELVLDVGSGAESPLLHQFGSADGEAGVTFRQALQGAAIDLRDFGGGTRWRITIRASLPESTARPASLALLRAGGDDLSAELGPAWSSATLEADAPLGWRSGLRLELPSASAGVPIRVDRIELERGRALPSLRLALVLAYAAALFLAALGALGLGAGACFAGASLLLGAASLALFADPVGWVPMSSVVLRIVVAALGVAALSGGALRIGASRGLDLPRAPAVVAVAVVGFLVWLTAMSYPLYVGRHFVYHSNIAEEIWKGRFLVFYLPHPENILSREAQWGGLVVPYPCLYHTLVAPLTALPTAWFEFAQKLVQAAMLAVMALVASTTGWRFGGGRAGLWAGIVAVSLVATFQLLGLAHFLTVFGCAAASLALGFLTLFLERLGERGFFWGAALLLGLAFLSYTASLLFCAFALAMAFPFVYRRDRALGVRLASATAAGIAIAFFLYYVHWVLPFIRESIPILLASEREGSFPLLARIAAIPRKLGYSFGSVAIPLAGLAGVGLAVRGASPGPPSHPLGRVVLGAWAAIVVVFSGFDLFFNFILKHHYFVMVPVAAGCGILVEKLFLSARTGPRILGIALLALAVGLGVAAAHALSVGALH